MLEGKRRNVWESVWSNSCLDLHLMSSGAARAMVHAWLLNIRSIVFEGQQLPNLLRFAFFSFHQTNHYSIIFSVRKFSVLVDSVQHFDRVGQA